jgi:hypothetical protein
MKSILSVVLARVEMPGSGAASRRRALPIEFVELNPYWIWQDNCFMGIEHNYPLLFGPEAFSVA